MLRCVKFLGNLNYAHSGSGAYDPTKTCIGSRMGVGGAILSGRRHWYSRTAPENP